MPQTPATPAAPTTASISGVVKDKSTGAPLKDYRVSTYVNVVWVNGGVNMSPTTKQIVSTTDQQGHYKLSDLPAAQYHVQAQSAQGFAENLNRIVTVAGRDLEGIDFNVVVSGTISGKVIDENREPVPGIFVLLVSREYYLGSLGYFMRGAVRTNDRGEYTLPRVEAGRPWYLVTDVRRQNLPAHSDTPLNPKMRRRVPMRTWFPSSPDREGAAPVTLRPGELREGVDIEVKKSASYCVAGVASTPNGPAALNVWIEGLQPSSGVSNGGGMFMSPTTIITGNDGEFRFCELYPGSYRLTVSERGLNPGSTYAVSAVTVSDQDVTGLKVPTSPGLSLDAEVLLEGAAPQTPISVKANVSLQPLLRTQMPGEKTGGRPDIPGTVTLSGLLFDDYGIRATVNAPDLYVKDVTYEGRSVRYEPLHLGSAVAGTGLRVTVGQDGATLTASVADRDGNPVSDASVVVMPAGASSEGVLAARIVSGQTDQTGQVLCRGERRRVGHDARKHREAVAIAYAISGGGTRAERGRAGEFTAGEHSVGVVKGGEGDTQASQLIAFGSPLISRGSV
jgi:hypothetical protein